MDRPLLHEEINLIPKDSLWYMLSSGAQDKEAENNILQHLRKLCRIHKIPINKSKDVMLTSIQSNEKASCVLVASYFEWVTKKEAIENGRPNKDQVQIWDKDGKLEGMIDWLLRNTEWSDYRSHCIYPSSYTANIRQITKQKY